MLCRACCSKGVNVRCWGYNHYRENEALVLGLRGSVGVCWVGRRWKEFLACGRVLVRRGMQFTTVHCPGFGSPCGMWCMWAVASLFSKTRGCGIVEVKPHIISSLTMTRTYLRNICECLAKLHCVVCSNSICDKFSKAGLTCWPWCRKHCLYVASQWFLVCFGRDFNFWDSAVFWW